MEILEEITKFVLYKSREIDHPITEALASFIIQTTLNPSKSPIYFLLKFPLATKKFFFEGEIHQQDQTIVVNEALKKLGNLDSPSLQTIQLQIGNSSIIYFKIKHLSSKAMITPSSKANFNVRSA